MYVEGSLGFAAISSFWQRWDDCENWWRRATLRNTPSRCQCGLWTRCCWCLWRVIDVRLLTQLNEHRLVLGFSMVDYLNPGHMVGAASRFICVPVP